MSKWNELDALNLNGFTAYLREAVRVDGKVVFIYELSRGDNATGFQHCRGFLGELEWLTANGYTNSNSYRKSNGSGTSRAIKKG